MHLTSHCTWGVQCSVPGIQLSTLYLGYSFFVQSCTWQRLRHAGCKGTEHPQANLLLVIIIIVIVIILIMIVTVTVIMMIMISMIQMLMIQAFMESILTHMCCSQIAEASCSEEHVIKSSKKISSKWGLFQEDFHLVSLHLTFGFLLQNNSSLSPQAD